MKAIMATEPGGPEVLELRELETPEPGAGEVRIRLETAALNHLDLWVREGVPGASHPRILGCEGAGHIDAVGAGVQGIREGDAVITAPGIGCGRCDLCTAGRESYCAGYRMIGYQRDGTYAQAVVVPASCAIPKPEAFDWSEAAAFPLTFLTAWHMIFDRGRLRPGEVALVMAAGSGVGQAAVQICRSSGAMVIATAGSEEKRNRSLDLGANHAVDYTREDWYKEVRRLTGGQGVDLVIDHTGSDFWDGVMKSLAVGGRIVLCGCTSGHRVELDLRFLFSRQQDVLGSYMGSRGELLQALTLALREGLRPVVDRKFPLEEARQAQEALASRSQFGKIVLEIP